MSCHLTESKENSEVPILRWWILGLGLRPRETNKKKPERWANQSHSLFIYKAPVKYVSRSQAEFK